MPTAKCEKCGHLWNWQNARGTRLKDMACPRCRAGNVKRAVFGKDYVFELGYKRLFSIPGDRQEELFR
ncbi:MAG: hypothetical protein ACOWYE_14390 [Desulfatiglandales bacterium]